MEAINLEFAIKARPNTRTKYNLPLSHACDVTRVEHYFMIPKHAGYYQHETATSTSANKRQNTPMRPGAPPVVGDGQTTALNASFKVADLAQSARLCAHLSKSTKQM